MTLIPAKKTRAGAPVTVAERIRTAALRAWNAGLSVIPIKADGSKVPPVKWRDFQSRRPTLKEMETLFIEHDQQGLALVCGSVSKNLEALDFESDEAYEMFRNRARDCGLRGLLERLEKAYLEKTPRGVHLLLHSEAVGASTVLARRTGREGSREVLIETRGQRAYVIVSPSCGGVHASGKPYLRISGTFDTIPVISREEREDLFDLARSFDEPASPKKPTARSCASVPQVYGSRTLLPGDDFNLRASWGPDILEPAGWQLVFRNGRTQYWRRPGKERGVSATTAYGWGDYLYVFSTNATLDPHRAFDKFGAYTRLYHGGDISAATRALALRGFGAGTAGATRRVQTAKRGEAA